MQLTHSTDVHTAHVYSLLSTMTVLYTAEESLFKAAVLIDVSKHDLHYTVRTTDMTLHEQFSVQVLVFGCPHEGEQRQKDNGQMLT